MEVTEIAIVKPIKVCVGNLAGLRAVIVYIKDDAKTQNGELVFTKECLKGKKFKQMAITKVAFHKERGRQYAHFVQSFSHKDTLTPEQAFAIGQEFIRRLEKLNNFQVVMAAHTNEPHMHIHYVINSVGMDGRKWQSSPEDLKYMREVSDQLCQEYGLSVIERGSKGHRSYGEYSTKGSWKQQLAADIAECVQNSSKKAQFMHLLDERGIDVDIEHKSILFTVQAGTYGLSSERKCSIGGSCPTMISARRIS